MTGRRQKGKGGSWKETPADRYNQSQGGVQSQMWMRNLRWLRGPETPFPEWQKFLIETAAEKTGVQPKKEDCCWLNTVSWGCVSRNFVFVAD